MKRYFHVVSSILLASILYACAPVTPATQEPLATAGSTQTAEPDYTANPAPTWTAEPTLAAQPTPPVTPYHPLTTRAGIAEIDAILKAIESGDVKALLPFIQLTDTKCTKQDGMGGPPKCAEGEEEGTPLKVLPFLGPEGHFLREDELDSWPGINAKGLYAIYEVSPDAFSDPVFPGGEHAILLIEEENVSAVSLRVSDGKIVRIDYILDLSPQNMQAVLEREVSNMLLAPPAQ